MVSTRRTARLEPEVDMVAPPDLTNTLRKKPVRRATAKKPEPELELEAPAKTSRSKTVAAADTNVQLDAPEEAKPKRGRPRKADVKTAPIVQQPVATVKPARGTTISTRAKKTEVTVDARDAGATTSDVKAQPARRTRATAPKAKPLSPKKITQVGRARQKPAEPTDEQQDLKSKAERVTRPRSAASKRAAPDENLLEADDPSAIEGISHGLPDAVSLVSDAPVKASTRRPKSIPEILEVESEASMSSRPTTPSHSPAPNLGRDEDDHVELDSQPTVSDDEADDMDGADDVDEAEASSVDGSDDELCGPKTPMKRSSPGAEARYLASVQRTIRRAEDEISVPTPARRLVVIGRTPQPQRPYARLNVPTSVARSMRAVRGSRRPFVLDEAQPSEEAELIQEKAHASPFQYDSAAMEEQSEHELQLDIGDVPAEHTEEQDEIEISSHIDAEQQDSEQAGTGNALFENESSDEVICLSDDQSELEDSILDRQDPHQQAEMDPDETELIEDDEESVDASSPVAPSSISSESADTVLVLEQADDSVIEIDSNEEEEEDVSFASGASSPEPETLMWDNLRLDVTVPITVNFDAHFADVRALPAFEATERLDWIDSAAAAEVPETVDEAASAHGVRGLGTTAHDAVNEDAAAKPSQVLEQDDTIDFSAFLTKAALGEASPVKQPLSNEPEQEAQHKASLDHPAQQAIAPPTASENDVDAEREQISEADEADIPHYALPTVAFDARRKSLPAFGARTPTRPGARPSTSDGASIARVAIPFEQPWWARSRANSTAAVPQTTPVRARRSSIGVANKDAHDGTSTTASATSPCKTPADRYPRLGLRHDGERPQSAATPARFRTPVKSPMKHASTAWKPVVESATSRRSVVRPRQSIITATNTPQAQASLAPVQTPGERYPRRMPNRYNAAHAKTVAAPSRFRTPMQVPAQRPSTSRKAVEQTVMSKPVQQNTEVSTSATPAPEEANSEEATASSPAPLPRTPSVPPTQQAANLHAQTVRAASRRPMTPVQTPLRRPTTVQKHGSLRKLALTNTTPLPSHAPVKTPLKAAASSTPSSQQPPMTPHPSAPLHAVLALVEVFTLEGASASIPFIALLHRLGAKTTKLWSDKVTHVVFKDGSPTTLQRVRLHNRGVDESGDGAHVFCVNSRWVSDCDAEGVRMPETDEKYAVDLSEVPRGGRRRRKSMEPGALLNLNGIVVRDRQGGVGRSSLGRSSPLKAKVLSPVKLDIELLVATRGLEDKENVAVSEEEEPATPAYLKEPEKLVQQTAPVKRVRKLGMSAQEKATSRRLTFWNGGA